MCRWLQKQSFQSPPFLPPLGGSGESLGPPLSNGMILVQIYPSGSLKTFHSPLYRVMSSLWHPQTMFDLCTPPGDSQMAPPALCPVWRFTIREGMQKVNASLLLQRRPQQVKILIHLPVAHLWHNFRYTENKAPCGNLGCFREMALFLLTGFDEDSRAEERIQVTGCSFLGLTLILKERAHARHVLTAITTFREGKECDRPFTWAQVPW